MKKLFKRNRVTNKEIKDLIKSNRSYINSRTTDIITILAERIDRNDVRLVTGLISELKNSLNKTYDAVIEVQHETINLINVAGSLHKSNWKTIDKFNDILNKITELQGTANLTLDRVGDFSSQLDNAKDRKEAYLRAKITKLQKRITELEGRQFTPIQKDKGEAQ